MDLRFANLALRSVSSLLLVALMFAAIGVAPAFAAPGDCDGTSSNDNISCSSDPVSPDAEIDLGDGDDILVIETGVSTGHVYGGNGSDQITVNGDVVVGVASTVYGDAGDDIIIVNGLVEQVVYGGADDDTIEVNGRTSAANGDSGADVITINGELSTGAFGGDGDDHIEVNGTVQGSVEGSDGDDSVVLGVNASVGNKIDGGAGSDTLTFHALTQAQANALNPAGDTATVNGHTYTWLNFENLIGLLGELSERGLRVFFASNSLVAVESNDGSGISFFAEHGRIAFVSFDSLGNLAAGESASYNTPNSAGWYVTVTCLGANPEHPKHSLYQVHIFAPGGVASGQFTFSN